MRCNPSLVGAVLCALSTAAFADFSGASTGGCTSVNGSSVSTVVVASNAPGGSAVASAMLPGNTVSASTETADSTLVLTNYVTLYAVPASSPVSGESAYYYADVNGSTSWVNGISPPSTRHSRITKTVQMTVFPTAQSDQTVTVSHTNTSMTIGNGASIPTSTVTSYTTREIAAAGTSVEASHSSGVGTTTPLPSAGHGLSGWNASSDSVNMEPQTSLYMGTSLGGPVTFTKSVSQASILTLSNSGPAQYVAAAGNPTLSNGNHSASAATPTMASGGFLSSATGFVGTGSPISPSGTATGFGGLTGNGTTLTRSVVMSGTGVLSLTSSATLSVSQSSNTSSAIGSTLTTMITRTSSRGSTNATSVRAGSKPTPSVCGEHGDFVLNWDDVPNFSPTDPIVDPSDAPPVFNPYHHMYFSNGYVYLPPPREPFSPISEPRLIMFLTNETGPSNNPNAGGQRPGEIGAGDRASESAYWFNAYSAYLGCDNEGPDDCTMQISGYVWQSGTQDDVLAFRQNISLPACPDYQNCKLQQVEFNKNMVGLSGIQIQAFVKDEQRMWFMDDLAMGWYNNTCEAGLLRMMSR